jgi:hypothetical protein
MQDLAFAALNWKRLRAVYFRVVSVYIISPFLAYLHIRRDSAFIS